MISWWPFAFARKSLEDVLRRLKEILRTSSGKRLDDVLKKVVATTISDQSKTSLRQKLRRFHDVFTTTLFRLGVFYFSLFIYMLFFKNIRK